MVTIPLAPNMDPSIVKTSATVLSSPVSFFAGFAVLVELSMVEDVGAGRLTPNP